MSQRRQPDLSSSYTSPYISHAPGKYLNSHISNTRHPFVTSLNQIKVFVFGIKCGTAVKHGNKKRKVTFEQSGIINIYEKKKEKKVDYSQKHVVIFQLEIVWKKIIITIRQQQHLKKIIDNKKCKGRQVLNNTWLECKEMPHWE